MKKLLFILMVFLLPSCTILDVMTVRIMFFGRQLEKLNEFQFQGNEVSIMLECLRDMDIVINCGQNPFWDGEDIYECCP